MASFCEFFFIVGDVTAKLNIYRQKIHYGIFLANTIGHLSISLIYFCSLLSWIQNAAIGGLYPSWAMTPFLNCGHFTLFLLLGLAYTVCSVLLLPCSFLLFLLLLFIVNFVNSVCWSFLPTKFSHGQLLYINWQFYKIAFSDQWFKMAFSDEWHLRVLTGTILLWRSCTRATESQTTNCTR